jgi:hypothetical protein
MFELEACEHDKSVACGVFVNRIDITSKKYTAL